MEATPSREAAAFTSPLLVRSPHLPALLPGLPVIALMVLWAAHNGGYDADTWYWGALLLLALLSATIIALGRRRPRMPVPTVAALALFSAYVGWSYLSITWARSPGAALEGSNRALLYLLVFALMTMLPWTSRAALVALLTFVIGVGAIAVVLLVRFASADPVRGLFIEGRLSAPTGYFNSTAALFTIAALTGIVLAARPQLPAWLRGLLVALASADLEIALSAQSRGWLFTLPLVTLLVFLLAPDRLRVAIFAAICVLGVLASLHPLLEIYRSHGGSGPGFDQEIVRAGRDSLLGGAAAGLLATAIGWVDNRIRLPRLDPLRRRLLDAAVLATVIAGMCAAGVLGTHGRPGRFIARQWNGLGHPDIPTSSQSHFVDVGSGRVDIWRVALDAASNHPVGGLGQDNFADYYVAHRRIGGEPQWTHSLEMRFLAHTGIAGLALFAGFLGAAVAGAWRARRRSDGAGPALTAALLVAPVVWLVHGSIDWFWEMPALSGPALGFLAIAAAGGSWETSPGRLSRQDCSRVRSGLRRRLGLAAVSLAAAAASVALTLPYLSVREAAVGNELRASDPAAALRDFSRASELNPLSVEPAQLGGLTALRARRYAVAEQRFDQAIARDPASWLSWFGRGVAASALGHRGRARHDYLVATSINRMAPELHDALSRVLTRHPLTPREALGQLAPVS